MTMVHRNIISPHRTNYVIHNVRNCKECRVESQEEMVFAQYYAMEPNTELTAEYVHAKINFILVKCERQGCERERHERGKVFTFP